MARYYLIILIINTFFALFFYFKVKNRGLSVRAFIFIAGLSMLVGAIFPFLVGHFNMYAVVGINLFVVGIGIYWITQLEVREEETESKEDRIKFGPEGQEPEPVQLKVDEPVAGEAVEVEPAASEEVVPAAEPEPVTVAEPVTPVPVVEPVPIAMAERVTVIEPVIEPGPAVAVEPVSVGEPVTAAEPVTMLEPWADLVDRRAFLEGGSDIQGEGIMSTRLRQEDNLALLDSYITRGFDAKVEGKLDLAVKYFTSALELNPPPDLEVLLLFDVVALWKEIGQYQKAVCYLAQFEKDKSADLSPAMITTIKTNVKYLEILQETLTKANTPNLPFSMVPDLIRLSTEEKINRWKNEAFSA